MWRSFLMDSIINDSKSPERDEHKQCTGDIVDKIPGDETAQHDPRNPLSAHLFPYPYLLSLHAQNHLLYRNKLNDLKREPYVNNSISLYDQTRFYFNNLVKPVPIQSANNASASLQQLNTERRYYGYRNNNHYKSSSSQESTRESGKFRKELIICTCTTIKFKR